ncbi:nucleotidyltransferase family protein [Alcaligenaceae bacterium A4P071]|nr:nucleotidyltransferase family protein [Alcaligenaceae bacterium A4P071]
MSHAQGDRCIGLLLAGGLGRRFRASLPANAAPENERIDAGSKLLALLPDGRPVVAAAALALYEAVGEVWAVIPVGADRLRRLLEDIGCRVIEAPETTQGMGASIAAGVRHLLADAAACDATALMLTLGDMPWMSPDTLKDLRAQAGQHAVVTPVFDGQRGHPVTFARVLWPALAQLAGDTGARSVVQAHGAHVWVTDDPGVIRDVDLYTDLAPEPGPPAA